ncbi:uncharacterized protein LOC114518624 [Dendronephthya gigantea]|uniref:uncharacterized protein LOC114518624 n=1 Tax=Dendronephthya gigantea TaxID=151771 RepID=UPI00106CA195|nr:uncharacterized protein LOC114518624 [Dendronephthya gigantea]
MQCQRLNRELKDYFSRSYGLNRRSLLNDSRYFHVIGGLPQDAMHDILEGVLQYCVKEVLKVYIMEKKFLTLQELNKRIVSFENGYHNASNKPAKILRQKLFSDDHNLKQHANEMWCLSLYLPFLIGECVPDKDEHWDLFCLLQIIRIVFSPTISKEQIPYLQVLIQQHHEKFKELFPDCPIIPKMHYMVHMPRTILR